MNTRTRTFITRYENDVIKYQGKYYSYPSMDVVEDLEGIINAISTFIEDKYPEDRGLCTGWFEV